MQVMRVQPFKERLFPRSALLRGSVSGPQRACSNYKGGGSMRTKQPRILHHNQKQVRVIDGDTYTGLATGQNSVPKHTTKLIIIVA